MQKLSELVDPSNQNGLLAGHYSLVQVLVEVQVVEVGVEELQNYMVHDIQQPDVFHFSLDSVLRLGLIINVYCQVLIEFLEVFIFV